MPAQRSPGVPELFEEAAELFPLERDDHAVARSDVIYECLDGSWFLFCSCHFVLSLYVKPGKQAEAGLVEVVAFPRCFAGSDSSGGLTGGAQIHFGLFRGARRTTKGGDEGVAQEIHHFALGGCNALHGLLAQEALYLFIEYRARLGSLAATLDRKSTRLNSSHLGISYAVFC